jgi:hypothetical protein
LRALDDGVLTEAGAPASGAAIGLLAGYNWQSVFSFSASNKT